MSEIVKRLLKEIDSKSTKKPDKAIIYAVDGNRVDIRMRSSSTVIRNVEVSGSTDNLEPGDEVAIIWLDNRPLVLSGGFAGEAAAGFDVSELSNTDIENIAVKISRFISGGVSDIGNEEEVWPTQGEVVISDVEPDAPAPRMLWLDIS
ncbi:MAG: hypothetical protein KQI81_09005 [Deltaproteobacteria bacterium]|nr:hypothetical protein [Deltaproteobacteria bacterium]